MYDWEAFVRDGHYAKVCTTVNRLLPARMRGRFDAADFVQDAVVGILERTGQFDETRPATGLVVEIARRRLIDRMRGRAGWATIDLAEIAPRRLVDGRPGPDLSAEAAECLDRLLARAGDETGRAIVDLKRQGHSTPEAAKRVGWGERRAQRFLERLDHAGAAIGRNTR